MSEQQLDLFSSAGAEAERSLPLSMELRPAATLLDDQALIAAIPEAKREEQIRRVVESTAGLYGDLQGIAGRSLLEIDGLALRPDASAASAPR
jgi:hypothetical protein